MLPLLPCMADTGSRAIEESAQKATTVFDRSIAITGKSLASGVVGIR